MAKLQRTKYKKGFGLMEVLLSGVIIIMILGALVAIGHAAITNSEYAAERTQAIYLAQEGIETVRQIRDSNWIDGNPTTWKAIFTDPVGTMFPIETQPTADTYLLYQGAFRSPASMHGYSLSACSGSPCSGGSVPLAGINYTRIFKTTAADTDVSNLLPTEGTTKTDVHPDINAMKIRVVVSWTSNGQAKSVEASEILTNWRPDY
jgi:Tfp pilus assembly protein PilV